MGPLSQGLAKRFLRSQLRFTSQSSKPKSSGSSPISKPDLSPRSVESVPKTKVPAPVFRRALISERLQFWKGRKIIPPFIGTSATAIRRYHAALPVPTQRGVSFLWLLFRIVLFAGPPLKFLHDSTFQIVRVTGPSMSPYINPGFVDDGVDDTRNITKGGDTVLLKLWFPRANIRRGKVIAFRTPHDPEKWAIKRVVAVQGDRVFPLSHYPGYDSLAGKGLIVPHGHIWVEGDVADDLKRNASIDSNFYGPISTGLVVGKAIKIAPSLLGKWTNIEPLHFKVPGRVHPDAVEMGPLPNSPNMSRIEELVAGFD